MYEQQEEQAMEQETAETTVGALWDDSEDVAEPVEETPEDQRQEAAEEQEPGEGEKAAPEGQAQGEGAAQADQPGEQAPADQPGQQAQEEKFTLRHMDDPPLEVGREEVVRLAQQGLDYERVRTERDQLREYRSRTDPVMELVRQFAENSHMSVEDYVDFCRTGILMRQGVDEPTAKAQVQLEKERTALEAQRARQEQQTQQAQEAVRQAQEKAEAQKRGLMEFLETFPGVKAEEVPAEVWEKVRGGASLVSAYAMYQNTQLKAQLAAQEQSGRNAARTPGSMSTQGEKGRKSIAEYWDEE